MAVEIPDRRIRAIHKAVVAMRSADLAHGESGFALDPNTYTYLYPGPNGELKSRQWDTAPPMILKTGPYSQYLGYINVLSATRGNIMTFIGPELSNLITERLTLLSGARKRLGPTINFAKNEGLWENLRDQLRYLAGYAQHRGQVNCVIGFDHAEHSFSFAIREWMGREWRNIIDGGLIYHPSSREWSVHT